MRDARKHVKNRLYAVREHEAVDTHHKNWQIKLNSQNKTKLSNIKDSLRKTQYYSKNKDIPMSLKRKVYDFCILPVTTYGLETMALTGRTAEQLTVTNLQWNGPC